MKIYRISDDGLSESTFADSQADTEGKYWMILKPDELVDELSSFKFNYHTIYDCLHDEDEPRIEVYDNYSFGILNILGESDDFFAPCELDFYITGRYLIFIAQEKLKIITAVLNDLETRGALKLSTERILYVLLDKLTLKDYRVLENIELEIADVEDDVIEGKTKDYIEDMVSLKKRLVCLKRH